VCISSSAMMLARSAKCCLLTLLGDVDVALLVETCGMVYGIAERGRAAGGAAGLATSFHMLDAYDCFQMEAATICLTRSWAACLRL
jgi:hypothetical protein